MKRIAQVVATVMFVVALRGQALAYCDSGWCMQNPDTLGVLNPYARGVWGSSASDVFVVGDTGTIRHYDGSTWSSMISGSVDDLTGVWGASASDVHAVSSNGTVLHYNGTSWSPTVLPEAYRLLGIWGAAANDIFAVGDHGGVGVVLHYNGASWTPMDVGTPPRLSAVWGVSGTEVFAVGDSGTILRYNGAVWSPMASGSSSFFDGVWGTASGDVFVVGGNYSVFPASGTILHYNGSSWATMLSSGPPLTGVWGSSSTSVCAVGVAGTILHYNGTLWASLNTGTSLPLSAIWGSSATDIFAAGRAEILHSDGSSWSLVDTVSGSDLRDIWGSSAADVFAAGSDAMLRHDSFTWFAMLPGTSPGFSSVWGTSASNVFAGDETGKIYRFDGSFWSFTDTGTGAVFADIWGSSGSDIFAVGSGGQIQHFNGASWSPMTSGVGVDLTGVWGSSGNDVFAVGSGGTIIHYNGVDWSTMTTGVTVDFRSVWGSSGLNVFAVGVDPGSGDGVVMRYNGSAWSSSTSVTALPLTGIWGSSGNNVFVVGDAGNILHFDGSAWAFRLSEPAFSELKQVWGTASGGDVFVVGLGGLILHLGPPAALTLIAPSGTVTTQPAYQWGAQDGVDSYQLWVGTASTTTYSAWVTASEAGCGSGEPTCSFVPPPALAEGSWYFNVRGRNLAGTGPWTTSKLFTYTSVTAPTALTLVAPTGIVATSTPTYQWSAQAGVDSYQLWVGTGSTTAVSQLYTASAAGCGSGEPTCHVTPGTALAQGAWYFNVRGRNTAGTGPWTTAKSFSYTVTVAPTALTLISPSGPIGTNTPTYTWDARAGVVSYQLWVGTGSSTVLATWYTAAAAGCGSGELTCSVSPVTVLANGTWYFNVRGQNLAGTGPWTTSKRFSTP